MIGKLTSKIRAVAGDEFARKLAGGALVALIIKTASAGLTFLMFVLLARAMSDVEYGRFAFAFSLALFLALAATLGQPKLVLRFLSRYVGADDPRNARAVVGFSLFRVILASSLMAIAFIAVLEMLHPGGLLHLAGLWASTSLGLLVVAFALAEYYSHSLRALGRVSAALTPRDVIWRGAIAATAGAAILTRTPLGADQGLLFCAATLALTVAIQAHIFHRIMNREIPPQLDKPPLADKRDLSEWKKATHGLALLAVVSEGFQHFFVVATGFALTAVDAGHFFAAAKTATLLSLPLVATNMITAPMISRHFHKKESAKLQDVCRMAIALAAPITIAGVLFLVLFGRPILEWFGPGFSVAHPALLLIASGHLVNALCGPTGFLMMMTGHERRFFVFLTVSNLTGLAALAALAPVLGLTGTAIGVTIAQSGWNLAAWVWARRTLRVDPTALALCRRLLPRAAAS